MKAATHAQAFAALRTADPISPADLGRLAEHAAARTHHVLARAQRDGVPVARRAPFPQRPKLVAGAALVIALFVPIAASALGIAIPVVDFSHAEKAPERAIVNFESLSVGAPPGMDPKVIAGAARELQTTTATGKEHTVWVAPTESGGFCYQWMGAGGGGCDRLGTAPLGVGWWAEALPGEEAAASSVLRDVRGLTVEVSARYVATVELRFVDGSVVRPPITWVSEPIDHGFFFYRLRPHERIAAVVALDERRRVVTQERACCELHQGRPADAIASEKRIVASVSTVDGAAVVWEAPTRYAGICAWFEFQGRSEPLGHCSPEGYGRNEGLILRPYATADTVIVYGSAADRFRGLEFRYADSAVERMRISGGYFVAQIPKNHLQPETRLVSITALGADESAIPGATFSFGTRYTRDASCSPVLPVAIGGSCGDG